MTRLAATILLPTHDRFQTLPLAVASVLAQTVGDIELFIMGDGVRGETRAFASELSGRDPRVRFFDHPKHESRGEPWRHAALQEARGRIVCYLCDRDLWLPDHVESLLALLADGDFAHTLPVRVLPDGRVSGWTVDLADAADRRIVVERENRIPLSAAGHTLERYRRLPFGWRIAGPGMFTDHAMWQQILAQADCKAVSGMRPTALVFSTADRRGWTQEQWHADVAGWHARLGAPAGRAAFVSSVYDEVARDRAKLLRRLHSPAALADGVRALFRMLR